MKAVPTISASSFLGLDDADRAVALELVTTLNAKRTRNELRRTYYEGHNRLRDLGISIPPQLKTLEVVVGWPTKAVDSMSRRTILHGFTSEFGGEELTAMVERIWDDNRMASEVPAAHTSSLTHSCAFAFVTRGDVAAGEPEVVVAVKSAEDAAALWDARRRAVRAALSVVERDPVTLEPIAMNLYVPGRVLVGRRNARGIFEFSPPIVHAGGVPVEALPYRASLTRPFGRSRISRAVMYYTDAAVRTMVRTEVGAEFYNAPRLWGLGVDDDAFTDDNGNPVPLWQIVMGRMNTISRDPEGNLPVLQEFTGTAMTPNIEHLRAIAQQFASEVSLPVSALGIVQDNPSSAEAMQVANEELGVEIEHWQRTALAPAWQRVMQHAVRMMSGGSAAALAEASTLSAHWGKWWVPNEAAAAQAALARVQAIPALAETDVELERMGYTPDEIARIQAQLARSRSRQNIAALLATAKEPATGQPAAQPGTDAVSEANATKAKADAMGVLIRAGVEPADAARQVGLSVTFTGAVPTSLRLPESDADALEQA